MAESTRLGVTRSIGRRPFLVGQAERRRQPRASARPRVAVGARNEDIGRAVLADEAHALVGLVNLGSGRIDVLHANGLELLDRNAALGTGQSEAPEGAGLDDDGIRSDGAA